ncbi:serine/threonine protein kinase [Rhizobium ruizarguesonis]|uniref:serine/threonine-protein kinase n=1 Tax=Rhizobium ruizarguesonis TaxID=2081791 RepID=UPI0010325B54|nr:serine/threonine-protein kinase [Rhizobium ruizarguesonis]TBB27304.1 serine/threonine protein kinase [Rhizobium ruizarguesonis]
MTGLRSRLTVGAKIGNGHFGDVHEGIDPIHGVVAVKILRQRPQESNADWVVRREGLLNEGERLKKGAHDHVVAVHHLLEAHDQDAIHLVMDFCSGGSLQRPYERNPLSTAAVHKIATQVALGLGTLHARDMLHRDLKPGNILIDAKGSVKIGDFGLVTDNLILGYGSQAGYSDHIAPEVWAGGGTSVKTDIWALGMTLYRLLHGHRWYSASPSPRYTVQNGGFADNLQWLPHVSAKWRRIIKRALHDEPAYRYQNTDQLLNDLSGLDEARCWECSVEDNSVQWRREIKGRRVEVEWRTVSPRKHVWDANSLPVANGRALKLGGSNGICGKGVVEKELTAFFRLKA